MKKLSAIISTVLVMLFVGSCKENIDMSDQFTFTDETIISYLEKHDSTYSEYLRILGEVKVSRRSNSSLYQLLTARGHYTVFAPTNQAIQNYLDTLCKKNIITEPTWDGFPDAIKYDSIQKVIAFNSIIDGGDEVQPFQLSSFPESGEEFSMANMNDRRLKVNIHPNDPDSVYINGSIDSVAKKVVGGALIDLKNRDIPAINGYIHATQDVIAPSNETVGDVFAGILDSGKEGFLVLAKMLQACDLIDTLTKVKDEKYEDLYQGGSLKDDPWKVPTEGGNSYIPEHRYYGFTIFAEPDALWEQEIGKPAKQISLEDVRQYIQQNNLTPGAVDDENYKNVNNSLNQFLTYHMLPMRIPKEKLVVHYNERGYTWGTTKTATIPVFEYYTTMGKRRLLKIYESRQTNGSIYLNRFVKLRNGRRENYNEVVPCPNPEKGGILILTDGANEFNDKVNGVIYPIEKILAYDNDTRDNLQKERIRYDVTSLFPEFMNNNIRVDRVGTAKTLRVAIYPNNIYPYLNDAYLYDGCKFNYLSGFKMAWNNYQGDELNVVGNYEMVFRLPPVPRSGTYEIRYLVGAGSQYRGLCQVYFGESNSATEFPLDNMVAQGIPLDLRMGGLVRSTPSGSYPSIVGWEEDTSDDDYNAEVDKKMRSNGFMKAPNSYIAFAGGDKPCRTEPRSVRRIIVTQHMDPDKVYYLGFKNVMDDETLQFYMDFLEYCAKEVYDNPYEPEDIW